MRENEKKALIEKMWSNYAKTFVEYFFLKEFKKSLNHVKISGLAAALTSAMIIFANIKS